MPLPAHLPALILLAALALAAGMTSAEATSAEPTGVALAIDGVSSAGAIQTAAGRFGIERAAGDQLLGLRMPGAVPTWIDQGLVLSDGDVLRGTPLAVDKDNLTFASDLLGRITVPLSGIAALRFSQARIGEMVPAGFAGAVLANGDRLNGRLVSIENATLGFDTGKKTISVPRARVAQIVLRAPVIAPARRSVVRFANGDRLGGALSAPAAGTWELASPLGTARFPAGFARGWWSEGPDRLPLATLMPSAGTAAGADAAADGGWLIAGAQRWDRGLCCRAPSRLEYDIPAGSAALVGEIALGSGAGSAIFRVLVDGTAAFDSGAVAAGAPAKAFSVALAGRAKLALVVEPGPDCAALGARAVWGWVTLVK